MKCLFKGAVVCICMYTYVLCMSRYPMHHFATQTLASWASWRRSWGNQRNNTWQASWMQAVSACICMYLYHQQIGLRLFQIIFISIDYTRLFTIIADYFRLFTIISLRKVKRLFYIIALSPKRRLFHLFHYDYFTYIFRYILLRLLRLWALYLLKTIIHIILFEMYYYDYMFPSQHLDSCHIRRRRSPTMSYVMTYDIVCPTYDIVSYIAPTTS